jgi:hypothetical protein
MTIIIDPFTIPEKGTVELNVQRSFEIKVTAEEARRQVNRWLHEHVTMLIGAEPPTLVVGEQVVWRVPAVFRVPDLGRVGLVGTIDVEVSSGVMTLPTDLGPELERKAEELAERLPPYQPKKGPVPEKYQPHHIPPAPTLVLDEAGFPTVVASPPQEAS